MPRAACWGGRSTSILEDSATIDSVAEAKATKLVQHDNVDVIFGGIYSSTRQAIKGPAVVKGRKLYIYPEQYEGQECDPLDLLHRPGAGAAGRSAHPLADAADRREEILPAVGRLHLAAHDEQEGPPGRHGQRRHDRRRGVLPARSRRLPRDGREDHVERRRGGVQHHRSAGRRAVPRAALRLRLHQARRTASSARTSTRTSSTWCRPRMSRACTAASTTTRPSAIRSAESCSISTTQLYPGNAKFTAGSACSGLYRGLKLWEAAVKEAGSLTQDDVIKALDHAKIAEGPGGRGRDGARSASRSDEHVHRPGQQRPLQDRQEPRRHRSEGAQCPARRRQHRMREAV